MCPRSRRVAVCFVALAVGLTGPRAAALQDSPPARDADAALEQYLEDHGLLELLAAQLSGRMASAPAEARIDIASRLADIYTKLLERDQSPAMRAEIERQSRALLSVAPQAESAELRLKLDRAAYAQAERLAERWRVRLAEPSERNEALAMFNRIAPDLDDIADRSNRVVDELERQEEMGREAGLLAERLAEARRRRSLANQLSGWSKVYAAEMTDDPRLAADALRNLGWLLNAPPGKPADPAKVPPATLHYEHVARAAVGSAVAQAVCGDIDAALRWLDLLATAPDVAPAVLAELPARRMTILARAGRWTDLAALVLARRAAHPLPPAEARLVGVLAGEARPGNELAREAVRRMGEAALTDLATAGETPQVVDLATRYGLAPPGADGFLANYVRGLRSYEAARGVHRAAPGGADQPSTDVTIARAYEQARDSLKRAVAAPDAPGAGAARAGATMLIGLTLYYGAGPEQESAPRLLEAAEWLRRAAEALPSASDAAESLAGAIMALDLAATRSPIDADQTLARRDELIHAFLDRYPESRRAGAMLLKLATGPGAPPETSVSLLLRVPESSPAYEPSRREAARLLYDQYRTATGRREWHAQRYAAIEEPLTALDLKRAIAGDARAAQRAALGARRTLDALLSLPAPDVARAQRALDALETLARTGVYALAPIRNELDYRRAQLALARGETTEAARIVDAMLDDRAAGAKPDPFIDAARWLLLRNAVAQWRDAKRAGESPESVAQAARDVTERGARVLLDGAGGAPGADDGVGLALIAAVGEAAADLWDITRDVDARSVAIRLHRRALAADPTNGPLLRRMADLSEAAADNATALECWRTLSSGLDRSTPAWFEARYRLISLLAKADPQRAQEAMAQHRVLHPDFGPPPWGERLRELNDRLAGRAPGGAP